MHIPVVDDLDVVPVDVDVAAVAVPAVAPPEPVVVTVRPHARAKRSVNGSATVE
jgi:hypothetical protein